MSEKPNNLFYFIGNYNDFCSQTNLMKGLVIISFYASWVPNCLKIGDKFVELARENPKVIFYSIDIEQSCDIANFFCINTVPTIKILNKTRRGIDDIFTFVGADQQIKNILQNKIQELMTNFHL